MTAATPIDASPAHNLSDSSRVEARGLTQLPPVPRGDVSATLNFYSPPSDGSLPFNFVQDPPAGQPRRNYSDHPQQVVLHDIRGQESSYSLDRDAFQIIQGVSPSAEKSFTDDASIEKNYYPEVKEILLDNVPGSNKVFIFDHTIRRATGPRQPVSLTHIDQTAKAAKDRVHRHLPTEAENLLRGRYRIINVWRPLNGPVYASPLGFASSETVDDQDVIPIEHRYPDRNGQTAGIAYNPGQKWHYLSGMRDDERLLLECFDSAAGRVGSAVRGGRVPHSAFVDPRTPGEAPARESIEVRALVFGP